MKSLNVSNVILPSLLYFYTSDGGSICPASIALHQDPSLLQQTSQSHCKRLDLHQTATGLTILWQSNDSKGRLLERHLDTIAGTTTFKHRHRRFSR